MMISNRSRGLAFAFATTACLAMLAPRPAGATDVCALITPAEASAAMGAASLPGKPHAGRHASCRYYSADHKMNVFVQDGEVGDITGAAQLGGKPVAGIGDKAIWAMGSLFIQKRGKFAQVGLYRTGASMQKMDPQIVALGRAAAARM